MGEDGAQDGNGALGNEQGALQNSVAGNELPAQDDASSGALQGGEQVASVAAEDSKQLVDGVQQPVNEQQVGDSQQPAGNIWQTENQQQSVVPQGKPMDAKTKKIIILACAIGGGLLILGIAALVILPIILKVDYEETYEKAKDLGPAISDMESYSSCYGVIDYAESTYTSEDSYNNYVKNCKKAIEAVKEHTSAVGGTSGLRDGELKELWDVYKTKYEALIPAYEKAVGVYPAWHTYAVKFNDLTRKSEWYKDTTEDKAKAVVRSLEDSGVDAFKKFADGFNTKYVPYVMAYKKRELAWDAYYAASYSASNKTALRDAYNEANKDFDAKTNIWNEWKSDNAVDLSMDKVLGVDLGEYDLRNVFSDFDKALYEKYWDQTIEDGLKGLID